jgi:hypothetical protein
MPVLKLQVKGLKPDDESTLVQRLKALDGVLFAVVDHRSGCAEVELEDDCVSIDDIQNVVGSFGYDCDVIG